MKKTFVVTFFALMAVTLNAQAPKLPVDQAVRIGHLDNGLTYYIRHNEEPEGQANFYIAQKVGSILENEDQRGLAHFLEHMCFNGTERFPGNGVIRYCESIGVKFGADLNAYTSIDETVYNIDNVPVAKVPSAVDSCLWILHDWADGLLLRDADIDDERGVIHEEWRGGQNAAMRQYEKILPEIYPGNKYGERLPIGLMSVVDNFPYQVLRDYYEKWYRPDLQGIVVVGDIDVDVIEAKIHEIFGTIAAPVNPAERLYVQVEDNREPIISIASDKEQPYPSIDIMFKHDVYPVADKDQFEYWVYKYVINMANAMIGQRLSEILEKPQPPFVDAGISFDDAFFVAKTKRCASASVITSEEGVAAGTAAIYREFLRAVRGGFTASEYERARADYLSGLESSFNQRSKRKSAGFCKQYVRHFIENEPICGIENIYAFAPDLVKEIPVDIVNSVIRENLAEDNVVLIAMLPEKEGTSYPDKECFASILSEVAAEQIEPYEDKVSNEPLVSELPVPGRVLKTRPAPFGYREYRLSNGALLYMKHTDCNPDQIMLTAYSWGGISRYPEAEAVNLKVVDDLFGIGGLGSFSTTDLGKVLAGKQVSVATNIRHLSESLSASSTPKDFETMMQLVYLSFTSPRADSEAFESWKTRMHPALKNAELRPETALNDSLYRIVYKDYARLSKLKEPEIDMVDYARVMEIGRERFANAADFTFIITGNVDEQTALPLIEQYIASLPSGGRKEKCLSKAAEYNKGVRSCVFDHEMETPAAMNFFFDSGKVRYNLKNILSYSIGIQALTMVLLEEIREKEGGTYGIGAYGSLSNAVKNSAYMEIQYNTSPDRYEALNDKIKGIVENYSKTGPSEENLAKCKEYMLKKHHENLNENSCWHSAVRECLTNGVDLITDYESVLSSITAQDVVNVFSDMLKAGNHAAVIMRGTEKK